MAHLDTLVVVVAKPHPRRRRELSKRSKATETEIKKFRTAAKLASQEVATWPEWKKTGLKLSRKGSESRNDEQSRRWSKNEEEGEGTK